MQKLLDVLKQVKGLDGLEMLGLIPDNHKLFFVLIDKILSAIKFWLLLEYLRTLNIVM